MGLIKAAQNNQFSRIQVTLAALLPPVIFTPSAEISVTENTELLIDIGFNGATGVYVLADSALVKEPATGSQVNLTAGNAIIILPGIKAGSPIAIKETEATRWWDSKQAQPTAQSPTSKAPQPAQPTATPVAPVIPSCASQFLAAGVLIAFLRRWLG